MEEAAQEELKRIGSTIKLESACTLPCHFQLNAGVGFASNKFLVGEKLCYVVFLVEGKQKVGSLLFESYLSKLIVNWSFSVE